MGCFWPPKSNNTKISQNLFISFWKFYLMIDIQKEVKVTVFSFFSTVLIMFIEPVFIYFWVQNWCYLFLVLLLYWTPTLVEFSCEFGPVYLPICFQHTISELVHHFFLIFCMKLDGYKVRKVTKCNFCKKVLWRQERPKHPQTEVFRLLTKIKFISMYF